VSSLKEPVVSLEQELLVPPPPAVPGALAEQTGYLLRVAFVHSERWIDAVLPSGLPPRSHEILQALADLGPRSQRELASLLHINPPMMVGLIDAIDQAGLVIRQRNPADRRSYSLEPSEAGSAALADLNSALDRAEAGLTQRLDRDERGRLTTYLRTVVRDESWQPELPDGLARRPSYLLGSAHVYVRQLVNERLKAAGLTTTLYGPLVTLAALGVTSQQAIADRLGFSAAAIQQPVDRLEEAKLVVRNRSPVDRRAYALELTPQGRKRLGQAQQAIADVNQTYLDHILGARQHGELRRLLRKLIGSDSG
jgi:DNA-binding MarR family transcriptional regulator